MVMLDEAYRFAHDRTVKATSRTLAGIQHPNYRYDLRGNGRVPLTMPALESGQWARLRLPKGRTYLIFEGDRAGPMVAEVGVGDQNRTVAVKPGRYFALGRGEDDLLEGTISVETGTLQDLNPSRLTRVSYARLVRKGSRIKTISQGLFAGVHLRPLSFDMEPCQGLRLGHLVDTPKVSLATTASYCRSTFDNRFLSSTINEWRLDLRVFQAWDFHAVTVDVGVAAGAVLLDQRFSSQGQAPARQTLGWVVSAVMGIQRPVGRRAFIFARAEIDTYGYRQQDRATSQEDFTPTLGVGTTAGAGVHF